MKNMNWKLYLIIGVLFLDVITSIFVFLFENKLFWMIWFHWCLMFLAFIAICIVTFTLRTEKDTNVKKHMEI